MGSDQSFPSLYDGVDVMPVGFHFLGRFEEDVAILVCASLIRRQVDHREVQQVQSLSLLKFIHTLDSNFGDLETTTPANYPYYNYHY